MFENLTKRFDLLFKKLKGRGLLTKENIDETLREVRLALLEADVHFKVVQSLIEDIRRKAIGAEVLESLTPGQQVVKIVWQELCRILGGSDLSRSAQDPGISFGTDPTRLMLVGLQGMGKTTTAAKLALFYKRRGKRVLLVAADLRRPAAQAQLHTLACAIDVPILLPTEGETLSSVVARGLAKRDNDLVIFDTAGRVETDQGLMEEIQAMKAQIDPHEVFLVADAMTGHVAVSIAERFHNAVGVTGIILTKTEGDARGGALLSMHTLTGAPVRFIGVGEKVEALELFYPDRMASRILGMGDIRSLVEQAETYMPPMEKTAGKPLSNTFTLDDFRDQLVHVRKVENIGGLLDKIPGFRGMMKLPDPSQMEKAAKRAEGILASMTPKERRSPNILNGSRRLRIAKGSGTAVADVNRLLKQFYQMQKMLKSMGTYGGGRGQNPLRALFS